MSSLNQAFWREKTQKHVYIYFPKMLPIFFIALKTSSFVTTKRGVGLPRNTIFRHPCNLVIRSWQCVPTIRYWTSMVGQASCRRFETGGSLSRRVSVACPSPDGSSAWASAKGGSEVAGDGRERGGAAKRRRSLRLCRGARVRIKVSGHLCVKCSCDSVGRRGDLVRVAS
jgi:hypothetical protein